MKPLSRRLYALGAISLAAIIFVALNIAADATFTTSRLDLTQNRLYTLSPGTIHTLDQLVEPITLKFYYSKKVAAQYAQINAYAGRVRDLLGEYAAHSHGKIILEEIDAEPFTPAEDAASAAGLTGAPTDTGDLVYFGLVGTNTIDGKEVISFFSQEREPYLEYDLTSLIYRLATPKKPVIGIVSSLPLQTGAGGLAAMLQGQAQPFLIYQQLNQAYTTKMLGQNFDSIPSDVTLLLLVHPPPLPPKQMYAIDQFVLGGGHALIFLDPMSEIAQASQGGGQGMAPSSSDMRTLLRAWGVDYDPSKVVLDRALAQPVQTSNDPRNPVTRYPLWLHLDTSDFDSGDQVTANLQTLNLASVGALSPLKGATTTFQPLIRSSDEASLMDAIQAKLDPRPQDLMNQVEPTGRRYTIAARISGPVKTAFPDGPPTLKTASDPPAKTAQPPSRAPQIKVSKEPINVIIMADSDIFDDRFWVHLESLYGHRLATPFADNGAFVLNSVENLTGSNDLISLRTRATSNRPFLVVQKMQGQAQARFQQEADALKQRLSDTETRLHALEQGGGDNGQSQSGTTLSQEQQREIARFRKEMADTRAQLRDVQHSLRKDIDALGSFLAFINIALVPILVATFAIVLAYLRRRRRVRALAL
ncbi:MAG TPA: Gldg family protein [Rhizomicrobium sp.]|nr:Gldg family protein [Rhizomicrobium sp.]